MSIKINAISPKSGEPNTESDASRSKKPPMERIAYSIREWCEATGNSKGFVYEEIKAGRLRMRKLGSKSIILHDEGMAWLRGETVSAA
jgi:ribosomal protein S14